MDEIKRILREASGPIGLNEIKRRMSAKAVRHQTVRQVTDELDPARHCFDIANLPRLFLPSPLQGPGRKPWKATGTETPYG